MDHIYSAMGRKRPMAGDVNEQPFWDVVMAKMNDREGRKADVSKNTHIGLKSVIGSIEELGTPIAEKICHNRSAHTRKLSHLIWGGILIVRQDSLGPCCFQQLHR